MIAADPIGLALEQTRAEALADWLDERPPREKPTPDEVAGLAARHDDETAPLSRNGPSSADDGKGPS